MKAYLLILGSNIEPEKNMPLARAKLKAAFPDMLFSDFYETDPVGAVGPEKFWNAAGIIKTELSRDEVSLFVKKVESALGRIRDPDNKFIPRTMDIDILPCSNWQKQAFIMVPLAEIAAEIIDPETGKTFGELAGRCLEKTSGIRRIEA